MGVRWLIRRGPPPLHHLEGSTNAAILHEKVLEELDLENGHPRHTFQPKNPITIYYSISPTIISPRRTSIYYYLEYADTNKTFFPESRNYSICVNNFLIEFDYRRINNCIADPTR